MKLFFCLINFVTFWTKQDHHKPKKLIMLIQRGPCFDEAMKQTAYPFIYYMMPKAFYITHVSWYS